MSIVVYKVIYTTYVSFIPDNNRLCWHTIFSVLIAVLYVDFSQSSLSMARSFSKIKASRILSARNHARVRLFCCQTCFVFKMTSSQSTIRGHSVFLSLPLWYKKLITCICRYSAGYCILDRLQSGYFFSAYGLEKIFPAGVCLEYNNPQNIGI